jgi:lipopolysaccharide export LptBFGC system permease protein LptF
VDLATDILVPVSLVVAFILGVVVRRGRGVAAAAGVLVGFGFWLLASATGGFEDSENREASLIVVPFYALAWAGAVGGGCLVRRTWRNRLGRLG